MDRFSNTFSFSTAWNVSRNISGKAMVEEILDMGFNRIELNYKTTESMAKEILPLAEKGKITITSIHNVFPRTDNPDFSTDAVFLAHINPVKRKEAINVTIKTIEEAYKFGASAVVLHTSQIPMPVQYDDILKALYRQGKRNSQEYNCILNEFVEYRKTIGAKYLELTSQSLEELCNYIGEKGYSIVLGIENRFRCHQIPDFNEAKYFMEKLSHLPVYFWYDIGHGIIQESLGICDSIKGVSEISDRLFGVHIHDVVNFNDHCCPYASGDEYDKYVEFIKIAPLKVLEISTRETKEDIVSSAEFLFKELKD